MALWSEVAASDPQTLAYLFGLAGEKVLPEAFVMRGERGAVFPSQKKKFYGHFLPLCASDFPHNQRKADTE